jgi:pimeloyl-ACP methyl ester carboxylesterase
MANVPRDGFVTSRDGVRVGYRDHGGEGRGLVLLHGGGANLVSMDQYADRLGSGRRTVAVDVRSCGQSDDPEHFRLADAAGDVAAVIDALRLGPVDVVGHSLGGFVAGFYGSFYPGARIVSIDGFGPGMVTVGTRADRDAFRAFQNAMKQNFMAMTAPPDVGDRAWRDAQVDTLCETYPRIGYTAPNARAMAERNFLDLGDGTFRRHPSRRLFADAFGDDGDADILRMYRDVRGPALIIRCTESGAPPVLDAELEALTASNPWVEVIHLPLTHLAPAWDALDDIVPIVEAFLSRPLPDDQPQP